MVAHSSDVVFFPGRRKFPAQDVRELILGKETVGGSALFHKNISRRRHTPKKTGGVKRVGNPEREGVLV